MDRTSRPEPTPSRATASAQSVGCQRRATGSAWGTGSHACGCGSGPPWWDDQRLAPPGPPSRRPCSRGRRKKCSAACGMPEYSATSRLSLLTLPSLADLPVCQRLNLRSNPPRFRLSAARIAQCGDWRRRRPEGDRGEAADSTKASIHGGTASSIATRPAAPERRRRRARHRRGSRSLPHDPGAA